jgi:hypothetical protein
MSIPKSELQAIVYEVRNLAKSLVYYIHGVPGDTSRFGVKETAKVAVVTACRSLLHFLYDSRTPNPPSGKTAQASDLFVETWIGHTHPTVIALSPKDTLPDVIKRFDVYVLHLTSVRIAPASAKPKHKKTGNPINALMDDDIKSYACKVLVECNKLVADCDKNQEPFSAQARRYQRDLDRTISLL